MSTKIQDILHNIKKVESNPNHTSFIKLMSEIAGNPNDDVDPSDDLNSIAGKLTALYNDAITARSNDEDIRSTLNKLTNLTVEAKTVPNTEPASSSLVDSTLKLNIPEGKPGINGLTPIYKFTYDEDTGILSYDVESFEPTPGEEW